MKYECVTDIAAIKDYLQNAPVVSFDFETAPLIQYRNDPRASLDAHRACIVGVSLSVKEGTGIYVPLEHFDGGNADTAEVIHYLRDQLLGRPIYTSSYMPALEAGAKGILFGDLGYYWVADRQGRSFKRLNELYAPTGQVGFLSSERVDGKLILPEAVKCLQMKAGT